jgi:hypothetical protein
MIKQLIPDKNENKKILILTAIIEAITLLFRFGFKLESTKHTASTIGKLTMGIRIHHGYIGILILLINAAINSQNKSLASLAKIIGFSLALSDIIHHIILYLVTGSADFDLVYPGFFT